MELLIDHVSKRFKDKKAVDGISLELTPGVWGLLGANGAGKTTLMRMIAGIMRPTSGQVVYNGVPIQTLGERYREVFGFLPQDFGFHPEFTVKDYLAYVAALKGLPEGQSWRRIHELLERVSLLDVYNKKISKLSGGMRRRVGIAQALLNDPEVLNLDEPTRGLDPGERVREAVEIYQACLTTYDVTESYDLPEGVCEREILPIAPMLHGVKEAFADPDTGMAPTIMEIDPARIDDYYSACEARIVSLAAMEQSDSPAAQRKAVEMYRQVEKPFEVYPGMSSTILDYQNIMGFLLLLFCVVIAAPVFSADYQPGADDILRCTRYGRTKLGVSRLLAALFISAAVFMICAVVHILVINSLFGWECTKTSIQMLYSIVTLADMNIGELQRLVAVASLLSVLASVSFTLFLSSRCKSAVASLASGLVFCIAPVVLSMTAPGALSNWLCSILPASGTSIQASILCAITDFQFLSLGGLAVWTPYAMIGACIIEIPLFGFLAVQSYCRHTVY